MSGEGLGEWQLGESSYWKDKVDEDKSKYGSLAADVLHSFGIPVDNVVGGDLNGVDIKDMDAMTVIKLSLLEEAANSGDLYELVIDGEGKAAFKKVGEGEGVTDMYYSLPTHTYKMEVSGVKVVGGKPLPDRKILPPYSLTDGAEVWDSSFMHDGFCRLSSFRRHATITYKDPHLDTKYNDGIDNAFDITDPFRKKIGYVYKTDYGDLVNDDTKVSFSSQSSIQLDLNPDGVVDVGFLAKRPIESGWDDGCWEETSVPEGGLGVKVPLDSFRRYEDVRVTTIDRYNGISKVVVIGTKLSLCRAMPKDKQAALQNSSENTVLVIGMDRVKKDVFTLSNGEHYVVNYDEEKNPHIQFINNAHPRDNFPYGSSVSAIVDKSCVYYEEVSEDPVLRGVCILPVGEGVGILVSQIFVQVDLDSPSINIYDPSGNADQIAANLEVTISALMVDEPPPPVAYNGVLVDQKDGVADNDPTTRQDFMETEMERVEKSLNSGAGMTISLSSLDENRVVLLSDLLYGHMLGDNGVVTTYICGPRCNPDIGATGPGGGIINNVTYSYIDKQSYTVSVSEGAFFIGGAASISSGTRIKVTEQISGIGTVIQDEGNHVMFKVLVDGVGVVECMNFSPNIIRIGDRVSVTIHNHPVEVM